MVPCIQNITIQRIGQFHLKIQAIMPVVNLMVIVLLPKDISQNLKKKVMQNFPADKTLKNINLLPSDFGNKIHYKLFCIP